MRNLLETKQRASMDLQTGLIDIGAPANINIKTLNLHGVNDLQP